MTVINHNRHFTQRIQGNFCNINIKNLVHIDNYIFDSFGNLQNFNFKIVQQNNIDTSNNASNILQVYALIFIILISDVKIMILILKLVRKSQDKFNTWKYIRKTIIFHIKNIFCSERRANTKM